MLLDGSFRRPFLTPVDEENPHPFPGRLEEYDLSSYVQGMKVEAIYEGAAFTNHGIYALSAEKLLGKPNSRSSQGSLQKKWTLASGAVVLTAPKRS